MTDDEKEEKGVGKSLAEGRFFCKDFHPIGKVEGIKGKGPFR